MELTIGNPGKNSAGSVDIGPMQAKTADNPNGQNITVTLTAGAFDGGDRASTTLEHEGSHVADAHDWINTGFDPGTAVNYYKSEFGAYSVEASLLRAIGRQVVYPPGISLGAGTQELLQPLAINAILRQSPYFLTPKSKITLWQDQTRGGK